MQCDDALRALISLVEGDPIYSTRYYPCIKFLSDFYKRQEEPRVKVYKGQITLSFAKVPHILATITHKHILDSEFETWYKYEDQLSE